jgi:hypothetical protein
MAKVGGTLAEALGEREHISVTVPRTSVVGRMRLVGRDDAFAIKSEARASFARARLLDERGRVVVEAADDWNCEIAARHLAIAVRDPSDESKPLAALEVWRQYDDDQIAALWTQYRDLRDRLDPLGDDSAPLTAHDILTMREAVKKKEWAVLMSFGSPKLASFALSSAEQPAS